MSITEKMERKNEQRVGLLRHTHPLFFPTPFPNPNPNPPHPHLWRDGGGRGGGGRERGGGGGSCWRPPDYGLKSIESWVDQGSGRLFSVVILGLCFWPSCQTPSYVALCSSPFIPNCRMEDASAGVGAMILT